MTASPQTQTETDRLTVDEYVRLCAQEGPFEIIDGEKVKKMPPITLHGLVIQSLFLILHTFCKTNDLGRVFTEMAFVLQDKSDWVKGSRIPDLMFIQKARWQQYTEATPDWKLKPVILVPDLVVEVVSPTDRYSDVQNKIAHYLQDGVRLLWVLDPINRQTIVYAGDQQRTIGRDGALDGGDLLPGLHIALQDIFDVE